MFLDLLSDCELIKFLQRQGNDISHEVLLNFMSTVNVYKVIMSDYLSQLEKLYSFLSEQEKVQSHKFITKSLSNNYIVTHGMLRKILARYLNILPKSIQFKTNIYGKPFIEHSTLNFNMSHSREHAYYAILDGYDIGIDVEFINYQNDIVDIAKSVFTSSELEVFIKLSENKQTTFFYEAWTKKEAFIKALGIGLSYPIDTIDTLQADRNRYLIIHDNKYYLYKINSTEGYSTHIVVRGRINKISIKTEVIDLNHIA